MEFCNFVSMKKTFFFILMTMAIVACGGKKGSDAEEMLLKIERLHAEGREKEALDSIVSLRTRYPDAIEQRRRALRIWQEASLKLAQEDVMKTDSALQAVLRQIDEPAPLLTKNKLRWKRDSLKGRYDAMCGVVRMINKRLKTETK